MDNQILLQKPNITPPLDNEFLPAVLANQSYKSQVSNVGVPLVIGLERESGKFSRYETNVFPDDHPKAGTNFFYVERLVKFLLWQRGGFRLFIGGPSDIGHYIRETYSATGPHSFDALFMGNQVYEQPFTVQVCEPQEVPPANEGGEMIGHHLDGYRIGFDLGASDRKVSAVVEGQVVFSEEKIWNPSIQSDPAYHYNEIMDSLRAAASKMERLDAIGGSSAGIYINNRPMVASLFRGVPADRYYDVRNLFTRIAKEFNVPLLVINDGDVAALAGSIALEENGVLGIALGSSEAAGYVDQKGNVTGWLNELCFAPIDYNPGASIDEWSGDIGCGSTYFSQQCVFRLASKVGIEIPPALSNAEKLAFMQDKLKAGDEGAAKIWQTIGVYLGYGIAHYADFYDMKNVIILGRCTSGEGGKIIIDETKQVLQNEFPDLSHYIQVHLLDENNRRVGQAIGAASLPIIK